MDTHRIVSDFHEKTKAVRPQLPIKLTTYWAAILLHDKDPRNETTEEDYLWVKCHQVHTLSYVPARVLILHRKSLSGKSASNIMRSTTVKNLP